MTGPSGDAADVVRLFHGWADSPIWLAHPLPYGESDLSPELIEDLVAWDEGYYAGLTLAEATRAERAR